MKTELPEILIIDDDSRNIFALSLVLKSKGRSSTSAQSVEEGMEILNKNPQLRIVLMDMMMPDMDGYEGMKLIRNNTRFKNLPLIAVTAQAMAGDKEKCLEAGATDYVSKPIDIDKLVAIIEKELND